MANAVLWSLPKPVLDIIGWESDATISGSVDFTLPVFALSANNIEGAVLTLPRPGLSIAGLTGNATTDLQGTLTWPTPKIASTGAPGVIGGVAFTLPAPALAIGGTPGVIGGVAVALPALALAIGGSDRTQLSLPAPQLQLAGQTGITGRVALQAPAPRLALVGEAPFVAQAALTLRPQLAIAGASGSAGAMALTLRSLALAAAGHTGAIGDVTLTLPLFGLAAGGGQALLGTATLVIPMLQLQATGRTGAAGASVAYALHLEAQQALTQYTNFGFNSLTAFNGVYLGATDDGIFALSGATDAGVAIAAVARVGISDFGTALTKRVMRAYVGYKADGELELRVITDETTTRRYRLSANSRTNLRGGRVKIGLGVEARYWQFEIANVAGADFTLDCIEISPTRMGRRVNGSGA